ncbi:MAG: DUF192 domain-containing protein [Candidatus Microsaccharimonas sp.]
MSVWRSSTTAILVGGLVVVIIAAAIAFMVSTFRPMVSVEIGSGVFNLVIAKDDPSRVTGLSGVDKLNPNDGLLMAFASDYTWEIWMKDMKVPIDILWLDSSKEIIYIVKNVGPELSTSKIFRPNTKARYVIELPAGSANNYGISVGEKLEFDVGEVKE